MDSDVNKDRKLGLFGATSVGVGAIVGGGILALAGVAFSATGPSAIVAFALNGVIALLTALSFAEMASRFPESGGTYTFSKKVLSVEAAFSVGWVVWFASIVAAVLYAIGFAHFAVALIRGLLPSEVAWLERSWVQPALAVVSALLVGGWLIVGSMGGGKWTNVTKVAVFGVLVLAGFWAVIRQPAVDTAAALQPFYSEGLPGLIQAMGFTFIALQGFDLIAAVGGEVREPEKTLPRAMIMSLLIALGIYLPFLFVIAAVGTGPGTSISEAARQDPEGIVAVAARNYLGAFGYWLVIVAAVLSMFSALQANVYAASRIAWAMARDRTLPSMMSRLNDSRNPVIAVAATTGLIALLVMLVPDVATAGAASSLIFLVTFALAHWIAILVRQRSVFHPPPFRTPWFPAVPVIGGLACLGLAIYQGVAVPAAGLIAIIWLTLGSMLFMFLFAGRARIRDATAAAINPELVRLRGRSPLVLVPIANPSHARALITLASYLVPRGIGRVLLQNVVVVPEEWDPEVDVVPIERSQQVLRKLLVESALLDVNADAMTTIARKPMSDIARVASLHRCRSIVMGMSEITDDRVTRLERLLAAIDVDVVILRSGEGWDLPEAERILVPVAGRGGHEYLLARLLGSLSRTAKRHVTYLRVMHPESRPEEIAREKRSMRALADDQMRAQAEVQVLLHEDPAQALVDKACDYHLIVLGTQRLGRRGRVLGKFTRQVAANTECPMIVMSSRG
ncbi:MAG: amino acid permease [Pirellulaceae bacterium]